MPWFRRREPARPSRDEQLHIFYECGRPGRLGDWDRDLLNKRLRLNGQTALVLDHRDMNYEVWTLGEIVYRRTDSLRAQRMLRELGQPPHIEQ